MGLGHLFGLGSTDARWLCHECGRMVEVEGDADDEVPACPECGGTNLERIALL